MVKLWCRLCSQRQSRPSSHHLSRLNTKIISALARFCPQLRLTAAHTKLISSHMESLRCGSHQSAALLTVRVAATTSPSLQGRLGTLAGSLRAQTLARFHGCLSWNCKATASIAGLHNKVKVASRYICLLICFKRIIWDGLSYKMEL